MNTLMAEKTTRNVSVKFATHAVRIAREIPTIRHFCQGSRIL